MIEHRVVENVIETASGRIVDIISDFVSLKRRGVNYVGCCPFHNEKTGSFTVSPVKGLYKCFGCGKGGNIVRFIMDYEHVEFPEAIKYLGNKLGIEVKDEELTPEQIQVKSDRESMAAVTEYAKNKFISNLWETDEGQSVGLPYFRSKRGFRDDIIRKFDLGYSLSQRDALTNDALNNGYKIEFLSKTGLTITGDNNYRADRFVGRVIFPIHSVSGKVIAFGGRVMIKNDKTAKYLNSPESELYHKSDVVYGIYHAKNAISRQDRCYLVEGYADVVSMHQSGIENVVASSGTSLTTNQIKLIQRFTNNITVLYDGDAAGIHAAIRGIDMILAQGMNVKVLLLPDGEDPDSFAQSHTAEDFIQYIETNQTDFIKFKANLFLKEAGDDPLKKSDLINQMVATIATVQDIALRAIYVTECSKIMNVDETTIFAILEQKLVKDTMKRIDDENKKELQHRNDEAHKLSEQSLNADEAEMLHQPTNTNQNIDYSKINLRSQNPYSVEERQILYYFIKYIDRHLFVGTDREVAVGDYIINELATDNIQSNDALFNDIMHIYIDEPNKSNIKPTKFVNDPRVEISSLAVDFIESPYVLSKIHAKYCVVTTEEETLDDLIPRSICELRLKIIINKINQLNSSLKQAESEGKEEDIMQIINELNAWNKVKKEFGKILGERAILNV